MNCTLVLPECLVTFSGSLYVLRLENRMNLDTLPRFCIDLILGFTLLEALILSLKHRVSGLGMSATLGILTVHKGAIQLFSQPGQGTVVKLYLPISKASAFANE